MDCQETNTYDSHCCNNRPYSKGGETNIQLIPVPHQFFVWLPEISEYFEDYSVVHSTAKYMGDPLEV
jgi:hypothetical protein